MPIIRIDYDDKIVSEAEINNLGVATQKIVSTKTEIKDVFVYGNASQIKIDIAPIEIFIELSKSISDKNNNLIQDVKSQLKAWKAESGFSHPINLTIIPMTWEMEIGI